MGSFTLYHWVDLCYDSGILTSILLYPSFEKKYGLYADRPAGYASVAVSLAASFIASFVSGLVADGLGRRFFFLIASVIHTIGCIVEVAGQSQASFFAGRIITGLATGILSMLVPLYQSEIATPKNRGKLISIYQIFVTLGFCVAFWLGYGTYSIEGEVSWRVALGIQLIPSLGLLMAIFLIPESPRWLIYRERLVEAYTILSRLRHQESETDIRMEFTSIVQDVSFDKMAYRHRFLSLVTKGNDNHRKRTLLGMGIHAFTQLSGANAVLFYFPFILESSGVTGISATFLSNGVGGLVNFIATLIVLCYIDRWGRRKILVLGGLSMGLCMVAIAVISALFDQTIARPRSELDVDALITAIDNPRVTYVVIALLYLFIACFALSWGPIGWLYPAEIYPQMIRANAMGVTTACSYLFNLLISLVTPVMFAHLGWKTYLFFACMCLVMSVCIHLFYPETKGRSLEEIQLIFSGALVDQRADAHHPSTAAEALIKLEQIKHQQQRERLAQQDILDIPFEWTIPPSPSHPPFSMHEARSHMSSIELMSSAHRSRHPTLHPF
ncbi:general substrate transporter [Sporodiniella umbellata]|nr:general substrate transporter [Sporodiniella umbellata]